MPHQNIVGVFPEFKYPAFYERVAYTGRYACTICDPNPNGSRPSFPSEKAALKHEESNQHQARINIEINNPWAEDRRSSASADWASVKDISWMTPEQIKDRDYRRRVSDLPNTVEKWRAGFAEYARNGEMLGADHPPPKRRQHGQKKRASKGSTELLKSTSTQDGQSDEDRELIRPKTSVGAVSCVSDPSPGPKQEPSPPPPYYPEKISLVIRNPIPSSKNSPDPIVITPELRTWINKMAIEFRLSPTRTRQMREFIKLPTDTKINLIQHSVGEVRAMLFT